MCIFTAGSPGLEPRWTPEGCVSWGICCLRETPGGRSHSGVWVYWGCCGTDGIGLSSRGWVHALHQASCQSFPKGCGHESGMNSCIVCQGEGSSGSRATTFCTHPIPRCARGTLCLLRAEQKGTCCRFASWMGLGMGSGCVAGHGVGRSCVSAGHRCWLPCSAGHLLLPAVGVV